VLRLDQIGHLRIQVRRLFVCSNCADAIAV